MSAELKVIPCPRSARDIRRFLQVSYGIYNGDPHWVAPLLYDLKKVFTDANPLFQHAEMQLWIATRNGRDVGRIAVTLDQHYKDASGGRTAFFGFFECENNSVTSQQLFAAANDWAGSRGVRRLLGPMNPTTNDECGLLVEGFDSPPRLMMTYNPPYYAALVTTAGFRKAKDLLAYTLEVAKSPRERMERLAAKARRRNPELNFIPVRRKTLTLDLGKIKAVYNAAWESNWGFVPMTEGEIDFLAARLKPLLVEGMLWLAETPNEPVGFLLALPDFNEVLKPLRGRLLTSRLFGALPYVFGKKLPDNLRVVTLGVKKEFRHRGIEAVMLAECMKTSLRLGFREAEASWVLEDNVMMRRLLEPFGGKVYKTYRVYEREV